MTVSVGSTVSKPTHAFSLTDGTTTLGFITCNNRGEKDVRAGWQQSPMPRTALKMSQGAAKYEDFELPFTSIIQDDFSGGTLAEDFEDDRTKYRDGRHCDTMAGDVICGPKPTETDLIAPVLLGDLTKTTYVYDTYESAQIFASEYVADDDYTVDAIKVPLGELMVDYPVPMSTMGVFFGIDVAIYSDDSGSPDTLLASGTTSGEVSGGTVYDIKLDASVSLTNGTSYWIGVAASFMGVTLPFIKTLADMRSSEGVDVYRFSGVSWVKKHSDYELSYELVAYTIPSNTRFFEHRRCLYAVTNYDDGATAPKLFINGYRGTATSNSADKSKLNTTQDLSVDPDDDALDLAGCIALIIEGPGSGEEKPWRTIVSNTTTGTDDVITVDEPWLTAHTTATSYVILGSSDWWEIGSTGLTGKVTDVEIVYDYVALAQGSAINIRKFKWYNNSGTATNAFAADGTNKADLLLTVNNAQGVMKLWKALIADNEVDRATAQKYATDHTFSGSAITIGSSQYDDIKNMIAYGDPLIPHVIKENTFGSIQNGIYAEIPLGELDEVRSEYNGIAAMKHGVYLYFNLGEMIERYYDRRLDDVGLTRGEGLPEGRRGIVRRLLPYPGRYYALIYTDGNTPSIHCHNGLGWHEVWRPTSVTADGSGATGAAAPYAFNVLDESNQRSTDMIVQVIPGATADRLWFDHNGKVKWLPIAINPRLDSDYTYRDLSQLETAWIYGGLKDVNKYWHSIKMHTENLSGSSDTSQTIKIEYKVDNDTTWTTAGYVDTSPIEELDLSSSYNVTGYRIKFRFTLHTADDDITPRIVAYVVKGVVRVDVKKGWSVQVLSENERDLQKNADTQGNIMTTLDGWANSDERAAPLLLRHNLSYYDNKYVFIDPASLSFQQVELSPSGGSDNRQYKEIVSFTMYEV